MAQLKQRLQDAESERDKLLEELKGGHGVGASASEDADEMLVFPGVCAWSSFTHMHERKNILSTANEVNM